MRDLEEVEKLMTIKAAELCGARGEEVTRPISPGSHRDHICRALIAAYQAGAWSKKVQCTADALPAHSKACFDSSCTGCLPTSRSADARPCSWCGAPATNLARDACDEHTVREQMGSTRVDPGSETPQDCPHPLNGAPPDAHWCTACGGYMAGDFAPLVLPDETEQRIRDLAERIAREPHFYAGLIVAYQDAACAVLDEFHSGEMAAKSGIPGTPLRSKAMRKVWVAYKTHCLNGRTP